MLALLSCIFQSYLKFYFIPRKKREVNMQIWSIIFFECLMTWHLMDPKLIKVMHLQGCNKGQKSGGAGSNAARCGAPPPPGGAFWSAKIWGDSAPPPWPPTLVHTCSVHISFKNVSGSLRSLWIPYQNLCTWRHELTMWHIQIWKWHSGRVYSNMCLWWM